MRKLLWLCCVISLHAQSPLTQISDVITYPNGTHPSGTARISWTRGQNDASPRQTIFPGSQTIQINNGVVSVSLFPTTVELPPGLCYQVTYTFSGAPVSTRYWSVPVSAAPVTLSQIEGQNACPVPNGALIAPGQIVPGPASGVTVLTSSPSGFVSWQPPTGGGGSSLFSALLGGVNNSGQTMTVGNTSVLTYATGGVVAANQILTTPITGLSGTGGRLVQGLGSYTLGDLGSFDASGNLIDSGVAGANVILSTGSYANPSWITSLAASKLSGNITCAQLPGTIGDVTQSAGSCATLVLSTNGTPFALSATINALNASNINTGTLPSAQLPLINLASSAAGGVTGNIQAVNVNGGLNADTSHYLRGDMTWQLISAGGTVTHTFGPLNAGAVAVGNSGADITVLPTLGLTGQTLHANPIGSPNWALVNLTTDVTGVNPGANGGTGTAFLQFAGPTTLRTYTGPDANATLLTTNAAVTPAQGGFGADFSSVAKGGMISGTGAGTFGITVVGTNGKVWTANSGATGGADWETAAAGGTVTSIVFTSPLTPGTITTSGTVGCATCVTSAAALALNQLVIGGGSQAASTLGTLGTTTTVLHGNAGGPASFGQVVNSDIANATIDLTAKVTGVLPFANVFPSGSQTQYLNIKPNAGNNTTLQWESPAIANVNDYNFAAITPTGSPSLTIGSNTVTITLSPLGLNGADTLHYIYISGGTGTAEAVALTGGTCTELATACTLIFTATHTHSGAYTFISATAGMAEAFVHLAAGTTVWVPGGTYAFYAPAYAPHAVSVRGDGMRVSILQSQNAATGILDISGVGFNGSVIEDLAFNNSGASPGTQGTSGNYGIRLGNGGGNEASWVRISRCYFEPLYDGILAVNGSHYTVKDSVFYNFSHTGITVNDTTNNDNDALIAQGNDFFNYLLSSPAEACILITSTSAIHITDNNCQGITDLTQINNGFELSSTLGSQVTITANTINTYKLHGILMAGVYNLITITANTIALPGTSNVAAGIQLNGNNTTNVCTGLCQTTINDNVLQGPGSGVTGATAIYFQNYIANTTVVGNSLDLWNIGINTSEILGSGTQTIGPHNMENVSTKIALAAGTGARFDNTVPVTFATLPSSCANGSVLFCSDCNSGCTAGSSTGQICKRLNGAWTAP